MTYDEMIDKIKNCENFSFARYGDGELNCMIGKQGANCDGHQYFDDLGKALAKAFLNPRGVRNSVQRMVREELNEQYDWDFTGYPDADILHRASINGELDRFIDAIREREVVIVGPMHLANYWYDHFVAVPKTDAWLDKDRIQAELSKFINKDVVILYCCGMMAEVLIWENYHEDITQIDCGSVFDPYVGVKSRRYYHKLKI
jgi:hypothetical protein